ncbi:MAG TPA: helix-turn-helix domain-containing protein [Gemmatimonadaceae bacterium]
MKRRQRLEAAALRLFGKVGYTAASMEAIAQEADMPVGAVYQHYRSKRQLLLSLMSDLLTGLSTLRLEPEPGQDARGLLHQLLQRAFERDLHYLGAYRAWREAVLTDEDLAAKQARIHAWTSARVAAVFRRLQQLPGAREDVDVDALARVLDSTFWDLLAQASRRRDRNLQRAVAASVHLIYHALFMDRPS